jgi:hypothetical protein
LPPQNPDNELTLVVTSNNIDRNGVTFHHSLYSVRTAQNNNSVDFGNLVVNCPAVRTINIKNLTDRVLMLGA